MTSAQGGSTMSLRRRFLPVIHLAADVAVWTLALVLATWLRYEFTLEFVSRRDLLVLAGVIAVVHTVFGWSIGVYRRRWRYGSFDEAIAVAAAFGATGLVGTGYVFTAGGAIPRSVPVIGTALAGLLAVAGRSVWRLWNSRLDRPTEATPVVIVGAGEVATQTIRSLLANRNSSYLPAAMVDDDPLKRRLRIQGVPVMGTVEDLVRVATRTGATTVLLAAPAASQSTRRRIAELAGVAGLDLLAVPALDDVLSGGSVEIRPVTETDLLGRPPAAIDPEEISAYLTGRRVLVTGAGGSIGSELCRTIARFEPASLVMVDRDESGLHATQLSIDGRAMLDSRDLELADLRDRARVRQIFDDHRPEVVFHAAALKHLPLLEMYPEEAWKSNVIVTHDLLEIALEHGVDRFVNISTDKAADPTSVLGWTKRIGERLTADSALRARAGQNYISVRFGNVLGSRGSVLTAFESQVRSGGPITVTHPEVTRYFMTIEEAARLTVYAGAIGRPGEVLVLDMGEPVRILDVANRFAQRSDPPVEVVFTSLRHGEKVHEVLFAADERDRRPIHPLISHVDVPRLDWASCVDPGDVGDASVIARVAVDRPPVDVER
ncbi:MAG: polysaccharide biosynthesis protein [Ilumatobacteraceae bacterium]